MGMRPRELRDAALSYADRGWHVLPLRPRHKAPLGALVPNGKDNATADLATVLGWWRREPRANVGINAGASGLVVLDVDPRSGGDDSLHDLERQLGRLPETVSAETGGGGWHYVFTHPGGYLVGQAGDGLDVKDHGYIVAPPSVHPSGGAYTWDLTPDDVPVAELPEVWVERLRVHRSRQRGELALNVNHDDPLRRVPAESYVAQLTGREVTRDGFVSCPFHGGGNEREPSLKVDGTIWACYGCPPPHGKNCAGGNVYDFAGYLWDYALPLRGPDFPEVAGRLARALGVTS